MVVALGPTLAVDGRPVQAGGHAVPLPDALLYLPGSPFRFVHHPYRLVVLPMLLGGLAAAHALAGAPRLAVLLAGGVLAETLLLSPARWPVPTADVTLPAVHQRLAADDEVDAIWDFPPDNHTLNRWYQALAVGHGKRVPYGVNLFLPEKFASNHLARVLMGCLRRPAARTIAREGGRPLEAFLQRADPEKLEAGRRDLVGWGYDVVVLHRAHLAPGELTCLEGALGAGARDGALSVHRLAEAPLD
jgi:hypothetical protein